MGSFTNLLTFATPATTFEDLCEYASSQMRLLGFVNPSTFLVNALLGHTIESRSR